MKSHVRYSRFDSGVKLTDRTWPDKFIDKTPTWCAVDLRDGNQALINPMDSHRKLKMWNLLLEVGLKEIEIGFPSASQIEFDFARKLIEEDLIPDDVTIQVLVQTREHLIRRTFEALKGAKKAIVHIYNSTSIAQRNDVFHLDKEGIKDIAVKGAQLVKDLATEYPGTDYTLEYSPESFTGTEIAYACEVCNAIIDVWEPQKGNKLIINLPATVEVSTPNIYADQIEWMHRNLKHRQHLSLSLHTHNDRGTGVAASELGLMAGADRVEGTLFGNGERTGNLDIVTMALNMMSEGVDTHLNLSNIPQIRKSAEECNQMPVPGRHPYAGDFVFTAFSGSHQDAIKKGMKAHNTEKRATWNVPYLPIDPEDIGCTYEAIIRVNSQSGKGGIAFIMEKEFGYELPRNLQINFSKAVQKVSDELAKEITSSMLMEIFTKEYLATGGPFKFIDFAFKKTDQAEVFESTTHVLYNGTPHTLVGIGNGPINSFVQAMKEFQQTDFKILSYREHSLQQGSDAEAVCYISLKTKTGEELFGVGTDKNSTRAAIIAVCSAINRYELEK